MVIGKYGFVMKEELYESFVYVVYFVYVSDILSPLATM